MNIFGEFLSARRAPGPSNARCNVHRVGCSLNKPRRTERAAEGDTSTRKLVGMSTTLYTLHGRLTWLSRYPGLVSVHIMKMGLQTDYNSVNWTGLCKIMGHNNLNASSEGISGLWVNFEGEKKRLYPIVKYQFLYLWLSFFYELVIKFRRHTKVLLQ